MKAVLNSYNKNIFHVPILIVALGLMSSGAYGGVSGKDYYVGYSFMKFSYKEFEDGGSISNEENGFVPGLEFELGAYEGDWRRAITFSYHGGGVRYDGEVQATGEPIISDTKEDIVDIQLYVERELPEKSAVSGQVYAGGGYHYWARDIHSTTNSKGELVRGLYEVYEWGLLFVGFRSEIYEHERDSWKMDLRVFRLLSPTMTVDVLVPGFPEFPDQKFKLGPSVGWKLSVNWHHRLDHLTSVVAGPFVEYWKLGRSSDHIYGPYRAWEPSSTTRNYGLTIGLAQDF